jgi:DNA polymerase-3 subunit delta'
MAMNVLLYASARSQLDAIRRDHSGSYIFHGVRSVGKATAAYELARRLNCQGDNAGPCANCRRFAAGSYPDYVVVRPEDKPSITIEQIRTVIQTLALSSYAAGGLRLVLIDAAELMTVEAQNALLKLIEEPPAQTIFVLVTERPASLLPTVRSRCAHIHFPRLTEPEIAALLVSTHGVASAAAADLAAAAAGAPGRAIELAAHPELAAARLELAQQAEALPSLGAFERLLLAARLAAAGTDLPAFAGLLHDHVIAALRAGRTSAQAARPRLDALERFRLQLQAKVAPRAALERLMLEL